MLRKNLKMVAPGEKYIKLLFMHKKKICTFDPVHAATTSCIVHGVTITIKPNDMAAIVREADPLRRLSCAIICNNV